MFTCFIILFVLASLSAFVIFVMPERFAERPLSSPFIERPIFARSCRYSICLCLSVYARGWALHYRLNRLFRARRGFSRRIIFLHFEYAMRHDSLLSLTWCYIITSYYLSLLPYDIIIVISHYFIVLWIFITRKQVRVPSLGSESSSSSSLHLSFT